MRTIPVTLAAATLAACAAPANAPRGLAGADAARGHRIVESSACATCHSIPGVRWPRGRVGGDLAGFADRPLIAGRFPNQPDVLVRWVADAPSMDPSTAMPPVALTSAEARDVAAFLYTLR